MRDPKREGPEDRLRPGASDDGEAGSAEAGAGRGNGHETEERAEPATLGQALERIADLHGRLEERETQIKAGEERHLRLHADLENFKRRIQREKAEGLRYASEGLLRELLPVVDNLERAVHAAQEARSNEAAAGALITGVEMVLRQLSETLERAGVTRIAAAGHPFDPAIHEAVAQVERPDLPAGTVVDELVSGYRLHDRLLRAAQVSVSKAASPLEN